jgi:hypothetical protein
MGTSGTSVVIPPRDQDVTDGSGSEEQENFDHLPLRGWSLLHDGVFDPETESAYSVLGTELVRSFAQGDDPQSYESGVIDIQGVLTRLGNRFPDGLSGYVNLDWEEPFFEFLHAGPSHPRFKATLDNLVEFVQRFKARFPETVVTHYNLPAFPFWGTAEDGRTVAWNDISDECRTDFFRNAEALKPLLDELDWFCPRHYDFVPSDEIDEQWKTRQIASEIEHRAAIVRWLRMYVDQSERPDRKIIPVIRTSWVGGSTAHVDWVNKDIPVEEFVQEQVRPSLDSGADGLMLWEGYEMWMLGSAFRPPDSISTDLRENALSYFRMLGILGANEEPNWSSAAQKRAFRRALGIRQLRYVSSIASVMRSGIMPPCLADGDADPPREKPSGKDKDKGKGKGKDSNRMYVKPKPMPMIMRLTRGGR